MQGNVNMKKGLAALLGLAMTATIGVGVTSVANAAPLATCQVNNSQWIGSNADKNFKSCVAEYNAGRVDAIELTADVDFGGFSYETVNVNNGKLTINGNGKTISHVHFAVTNGASLTLSEVNINDAANAEDWGKAQIPVFVGGVSDQVKSSFTLTNNASLNANQGLACAFGVVVGNYADVTIDSNGTGADKGSTVYGSDGAIVTKNNSAGHIGDGVADCSTPQADQVKGSTITLRSGHVEAENSNAEDNDNNNGGAQTYAINSWGADVHVAGGELVEAYVKDATYAQDGGAVDPQAYDGSDRESDKYPVTVDGANAKAIIAGGKLVSNPKAPGAEVVHVQNGATVTVQSVQDSKESGPVFAAPTKEDNGSGFVVKYNTDFPLNFQDANGNLATWPEQNPPVLRAVAAGSETVPDGLNLIGLDQNGTNLTDVQFDRETLTAKLSPLHSAQYVYATWTVPTSALKDQPGFTNAGSVKLYGKAAHFDAYYDWYKGSEQHAGQGPSERAEGDSRLFAGWYGRKGTNAFNDGAGSSLDNPQSNSNQYPFAYFVSRDTQKVLVQRSAVRNGKFNVRVLSTVPNTRFQALKIDVTVGGETAEVSPALYRKADVKGSGKGYFTVAGAADGFGGFGAGQFWAVAWVKDVPASDANASVRVTPSWQTVDGAWVSRGSLSGSLADATSVLQ